MRIYDSNSSRDILSRKKECDCNCLCKKDKKPALRVFASNSSEDVLRKASERHVQGF